MMCYAVAVIGGILALVAIQPLFAADTGVYRGPENSGVYAEKGLLKEWPLEGPKLLWKQPLQQGYAGVAVVSGLVYIAHGQSNTVDVFTLDGERVRQVPTGSSSWKRFSGTRSTPIVEGDVVVTTTPDANIFGVDLKTQSVRWQLNAWKDFGSGASAMGWGVSESPMYHGGAAIFNPCSRSDQTPPAVAVDVQSGRVVWGVDAGKGKKYSAGDVSGACFTHNGRALIAYRTWRFLLCVDANTGRRLWEISDPSGGNLTPCYSNGLLLWDPSGRSQMLRLSPDGATYDVLWTRLGGSPGFAHAVVLNGRAYLFGSPHTRARTPEEQTGSLVEEGTGYVPEPPDEATAPESVKTNGPRALAEWKRSAERETHLLCLDAETGRLLQSRPAAEPGHIIAADGMVYVLELITREADKRSLPRVSLIKPTEKGFETTGTLVPALDAEELMWDSYRRARSAQYKQWAAEDFIWQKNINPAIAEGRLFLRYGPLQVYDLRAKDWRPQPTVPVAVTHGPDLTFTNVARIVETVPSELRSLIMSFASRYDGERTNAVQALAALSADRQKKLLPLFVNLLDVEGERTWLVQQAALAVLQTNGAAAASIAQALRERTLIALDGKNGHLAERLLMTLQQVDPAVMVQAVTSAGCRLCSDDSAVRRQTLATLKVVGPTASVVAVPLAECLASTDRRMVNGSRTILQTLGSDAKAAVPVLQTGLTNAVARKDAARTELIAGVVQGIDSNGVADCSVKLAAFIGDPDQGVAGLALRTLNLAGAVCVESVPQLVRGLRSEDRVVAEQSALMLNRLGLRATAAVDPLLQYVAVDTGTLRVVATEILGRIGPAAVPGVEALTVGLRATDIRFARASAVTLGRIGADAASSIPGLVTAMGSRDVDLARASARALGAIGSSVSDATAPALTAALRHGDETVRTNAVVALRQIGRDPVPPLVAILKGTDRRMASWAALALGRLGTEGRGAVPDLVSSLKDKDGQVVLAAVEALGGIGREAASAMPDLMALSKTADMRSGEAIQRTIDRIKVYNEAPTVADVRVACQEGGTTTISLPVSDADDVVGTLVASVVQGPVHGVLTRLSNAQFLYRAAYRVTGEDMFTWRTADRSALSGVAMATIALTPDKTPPVVTQVIMWTNSPSVRIEFDEPLAGAAAVDIRNYRIGPGVRIESVQLDTNGMAVSLHTGSLVEGREYTVCLRGLSDCSKARNPLKVDVPVVCLTPGLLCAYTETEPGPCAKQVLALEQPKTNVVVTKIDCAMRQRDEYFSLLFRGLVRTTAPGDYMFWLKADDQAWLFVGTNMVVESAGAREVSGKVKLAGGMHPLYVMYTQTTGTNVLDAAWSGPGFRRQSISPGVLYHSR